MSSSSDPSPLENVLNVATSLFAHDDKGVLYLGGAFGSLQISLAVNSDAENPHFGRAYRHLRAASHDVWNIASLVERLEFFRHRALLDDEVKARLRGYSELDIGHIHTEFRSIFDHVGQAIGELCGAPKNLPESFEKLIAGKEKYRKTLGRFYSVLEADFSWFSELRGIRTALIHRGSQPLVFEVEGKEDFLLFQVHEAGGNNLICKPIMMYNENIARLDHYVAYYFAHLLSFLESLARTLLATTTFKLAVTGVRSYSQGYLILLPWMEALREVVVGQKA